METEYFDYLTDAIEYFDKNSFPEEFRDYAYFKDEVGLRDAPAPFRVVAYDTEEVHTRECPDYNHDCLSHGCGQSWSTGGHKGTQLQDANGRTWRDIGIVVQGGIGF